MRVRPRALLAFVGTVVLLASVVIVLVEGKAQRLLFCQYPKSCNVNSGKPGSVQVVLMVVFALAFVASTAALVLNWVNVFYTYGYCYRTLWGLEEKLRIATKRLGQRRFSDDIMAQTRQMAPYDARQNDQEISTMLKSVAQPSQGKPV